MMNNPKGIAYCSLSILVALYIVGAVSNGSLRHEVQTLPLWFPIVLGFRQSPLAKWAATPCFIIWLILMTFIWLFLLGWAKIITGHFSPVEIAMTLVVGIACVVGMTINFRWRTPLSWSKGLASAALFGVLQVAALRISFIPYIATR
jgi:hypothetical protein